uniref:thioredoxin-dependent peroxiredoxin n=1 Tax=Stylophora pistillata TaxID=50429 RepID=A0A2B4R3Y6_STYPI
MNVLWEMAGTEEILNGVLKGAKGLIHGVTCGAGMPYRVSEIAASFQVYYYPIVSSGRAFRALWKRAYHKYPKFLGAVVYEDPWRAGGHNGLSNSESPTSPEDPYSRVLALRHVMNEAGLNETPIIMAGGVWWLKEWEDWIDNKELGPIGFQFGTRPILTKESPVSDEWKQKLLTLKQGDILLNRFSPTGFYSSAVRNSFLQNLEKRNERQVAYTTKPIGEHRDALPIGVRQRVVYVAPADLEKARSWMQQGYTEAMRTPDSTLIFVTPNESKQILADQIGCMGCLSACLFSNWSQGESGTTEIIEFNDLESEFSTRNAALYGVSTDSEFVHLAWRQSHPGLKELKFPLLADIKRELSSTLGVLDRQEGVCLRATFIVDPEVTIRYASVNDLSVGRNPKEVLRILDALQTGELTPCNWNKGEEVIKVA